MLTMTSVEAQNHFGMLLDTALREPVSITRRGRTVAYIFSPQEYEALTQAKSESYTQPAINQLLTMFRGSGKGGSAARMVAEREAERQQEL
jgi:prevent-host-death family protein